ncbi:unnamed protein product [Prunus brigantina]
MYVEFHLVGTSMHTRPLQVSYGVALAQELQKVGLPAA